ncbi:ABC-type transport auxiliary lipoprotein family protein [Pseudomonas sp. OTU5201]|uniref:ABC-type transport auxiliary lipoprotein family protein n=1 Tax=Pseudomonas sp. OTU5201 TaxID=3043850 RepID=UPI00313C5C14
MKPLFPLAFLLLLSACSILPKGEELVVYQLPASSAAPMNGRTVDWALQVNKPLASPLLDSTRIAVLPEGDRISAYQGVRWEDRGTLLLRDRLIDAFRSDGRIGAVSSDDSRLDTDLVLAGDLRAFQGEYRAGRVEVHILLEARLVQSSNRRMLASQRFEVREAASDKAPAQVVAAFGHAADRLAAQVLDWTLAQGARSPALSARY